MNSIHSILKQFTPYERQQVLSFASVRNGPESKKIKLLRLFLNHSDQDDPFFAKRLYGNVRHLAYPQLKKRLKDEIEEILLLLKPCDQNQTKLNRIQCSKLILRSQLVLARNLRNEGTRLLEKALKKVVQHGFHDLVLTIFSIAQEYEIPEVLSREDLPDVEFGIKSHLQILANQVSHQPNLTSATSSRNVWLEEMLKKLNSNQKTWTVINSLKNSTGLNFEEALIELDSAELELVSPSSNGPIFWQFLTTKLELYLHQEKYDEIISLGDQNRNYYTQRQKIPQNYFQLLFLGHFHLGLWNKCQAILQDQLKARYPTSRPIWNYYKAMVDFKNQKFHQSLHEIHESLSELKHHGNFLLGAKILELMILVEQKDQDWLDYKIENFRKLLSRWKGKSNQRIGTIFKLISELNVSDDRISELPCEKIFKLFKNTEEFKWNPAGFEVIRFDTWILKYTSQPQKKILHS